jgi:hypothetical protein
MADEKALPWVREFLEDGNEAVRLNGLAVLRNILDGPLGDEELATARELFDIAESESPHVAGPIASTRRKRGARIRIDLATSPGFL